MGKMKKKYESGAATAYIARNQAIKKLQLTIADFRRLCILKGVYPVEPKNKKKVNKGSTANRTFYYLKDINYLAHEPLINKFRDFKVYVKRLKRARGRRDGRTARTLRENKPGYKLDHIVKERYPTFVDAVRDLDDCLSLIFLFSILPKSKRVYVERVHMCKLLSLQFLHYVIASKSLRKCFISIKGYYFQADILGQKITWMMPHKLAYQNPDDVDFRIMSTFVEFYSVLLGFINFKMYHEVGLFYPPKLSITNEAIKKDEKTARIDEDEQSDEFLSSLNCDVVKINQDDAADNDLIDEFPLVDEENPDMVDQAKIEENNLQKLKNLFKGLKFFLNREIPREQFTFAIRAFSGHVSWDKIAAPGSTYQESDASITHHIIDRPVVGKAYLNRVYVQPQWIFDCINENVLLPVDEYLPGAALPPHLSPFADSVGSAYIPPDKLKINDIKAGVAKKIDEAVTQEEYEKEDSESEQDEQVEDEADKDKEEEEEPVKAKKAKKEDTKDTKKVMAVVKGKVEVEDPQKKLKKQKDEEKKLSEMMIPKKNKRLYSKIMFKQKKERQEAEKLKEKRQIYEKNLNKEKKKSRK